MAFVSSSNNNTSSTNGAVNTAQEVNTAHGVSTASSQVNVANSTNIDNFSGAVICAFFASQPNSPQLVHEDLQQIHPDGIEEMDFIMQFHHPTQEISCLQHLTCLLLGNPQMDLHDQGVIDSGCSRHMTGNMSYLTDYEEIDGGYVAFGGNPKGGKITGKATIKT
ncbi:hypothetical protein Tco_1579964, partial [Tanacetum coccineum]